MSNTVTTVISGGSTSLLANKNMSKETARVRRPSSRSAKQLKMLKELLPFLVSLITHSMCELYALNQTGYMHIYSARFITVCPLSVY